LVKALLRSDEFDMGNSDSRHGEGGPVNPLVEPSVSDASLAAGDEGADILVFDAGAFPNQAAGETVVLELEDLLLDDSGEVVLFAGEDLPVNIMTDEPLTDAGIAEAHVTATGVDVTGHHFYSFESGITLYSPNDVLIVSESGAI
jgi:hypothetical protein